MNFSFKCSIVLLIAILCTACATDQDGYAVKMPSMAQAHYLYQHQQYPEAIQALTLLANYGKADAQYALGYMYYEGQGTAKSYELARGWFERAAKQGNKKAAQALQMMAMSKHDVY